MPGVELHATRCPICGTAGNASELYPANFDAGAFSPAVFSARRLPDRLRYRMVKCDSCGLVRSDPVADADTLSGLYAAAALDYTDEIPCLRRTYGRYLERAGKYSAAKSSLLEIGCGSGFFLEEALARGYAQVRGVEPGAAAVRQASPAVRDSIHEGIMRPGLFPDNSFDVVCLFQVLDHIPGPGQLLDCCLRALKPGGALLLLNHNADAVSARLLGARSPIVDIEHTFLYGDTTLKRLVQSRGFRTAEAGAAFNTYSLNYLGRLLPLPAALKRALLGFLANSGLGKFRLTMPLGNIYLIAVKPAEGTAP
ncbi:MAG TPA: class I SAM-dependent methyltransferase [Elusimicrobiales bacterium]|nr:class I SAM-dependent methyltransferase [Elusimicrobiales bacterium]